MLHSKSRYIFSLSLSLKSLPSTVRFCGFGIRLLLPRQDDQFRMNSSLSGLGNLLLSVYSLRFHSCVSFPPINPKVCHFCCRSGSTDVTQKTSPATPRSTRLPKPGVPVSGPISRTPPEGSPKPAALRSPKSPASEVSHRKSTFGLEPAVDFFFEQIQGKRVSRASDLESQLLQAQQELKKTKETLSAVESSRRRALQEAEEAKKQYLAMASKLDEKHRELLELSASEDERIQELRKLSLERDRAWQSELDAVQRQSSLDSSVLSAAINEIQKLKLKVEVNEADHQRLLENAEKVVLEGKILSALEVQSVGEFAERVKAEAELKEGELRRALIEKDEELRRVKEELESREDEEEKIGLKVKNQAMEAELRRVKIQSEQWRKAAEAATAILSADEGKLMNPPYEEEEDDDAEGSPQRKSTTGLRKLFWKKGQK